MPQIHYCFSPLSTNIWESRLCRLFQTKTRAFGANAPSSVAFHIQLKLFKRSQKVKPESKNSKSESGWVLLLQPLSLRNTWSYYCKKIGLDPPVLAPSSSPPLAPSPSLLRPKRSPHLDQVVVLLLLRWATSWPLRARPPTFITTSEHGAIWAGHLLNWWRRCWW